MNRLAILFQETEDSRRGAGDWKPVLSFSNLCLVQGVYYLLTGLWPLLNLSSYEAINGPLTDPWLVRAVGLLIAIVASVLLLTAWRRLATPEVAVLAMGSAVALTAIDVFSMLAGGSPVHHVLDGLAEGLLLAGWVQLRPPEKHVALRAGFALPHSLHELPR